MENQSSQLNVLSEIIADDPDVVKRTLHVTLPSDSPKLNFGSIAIPKCQKCNAYISQFCKIKNSNNSQKVQYACAFCKKKNEYPSYLPTKFQQIPNVYKVEILPSFQPESYITEQTIPEMVLLIDRSFPFFESMKNALPDALQKFDRVFDVTVLIYCRGISYCKLDTEEGVQSIIQYKTYQDPNQSPIFDNPRNLPNKNNEIFRKNLRILLQILNQQQQQRQKNSKSYQMKRNGPQWLYWISKYLVKFNLAQKWHILWFGWTPMYTLKSQYQGYHYNIFTSCFLAQNQQKPLSKIVLQNFIKDKYSVTLLHDINNFQKAAQQLHYRIHQELPQSRVFNYREQIKSKIPGSIITYSSFKQNIYDKKYGIYIEEKIKDLQKPSKKIKASIRGRKIKSNIIQIVLFYMNFQGKKIMEIATFDHSFIVETEHLNRYMLMYKTLNGYPYFDQMNPQIVCNSSTYLSELLNFIIRFQPKQKKLVNQMNKTWIQIHFGIRKMDLNTIYLIWPILYCYDEKNWLLFCYRWSYVIGQAQISWNDCIQYFANVSKSFYSYYQQHPPLKLPIFNCIKNKHYFDQHHMNNQNFIDPQKIQVGKSDEVQRQVDLNVSCLFVSQYYYKDYDEQDEYFGDLIQCCQEENISQRQIESPY